MKQSKHSLRSAMSNGTALASCVVGLATVNKKYQFNFGTFYSSLHKPYDAK